VVRHPIYTGLLASALGATVAVGEWRGLLGLALMTFAFMVKIKYEERLMLETFPAVYPSYRGRVKALIPGLW
jgi:protein-S-isoprenylcysteine O-methyltransferase Ste14